MDDMERKEAVPPWSDRYLSPETPQGSREYPAGKKELIFGTAILLLSFFLCNSIVYGGFNLGFSLGLCLCILCGSGYLLAGGHKLTPYSSILLLLSLFIGAGFARSDDGFVKFIMLCFLFVSSNLALTVLAGKPRHRTCSFATLLDAFYTAFAHSFFLTSAFGGLRTAFRKSGTAAKKGGAILTGVIIAVPLLLIMVFLLVRADAAFEGLMDLLPELDLTEVLITALFGTMLACLLYTKGTSLHCRESSSAERTERKGVSALTVNTVLIAVCLVYLVYLFSQLAYFAGGFAGILPDGYTMAEYARRGFFEMAWLCAINLGIIALGIALVEKKEHAPLSARLLCLFISVITVFLVAAASGKMFLYIGTYGLTRLRVLTQVIMLFLCLSTVLVAVWLFVPKLPYMKWVIIAALIIGGVVFWADVDTVVARYNVNAYLSGKVESVDVEHLGCLNGAAIPHIAELAEKAPDPEVRERSQDLLDHWYYAEPNDFRDWNYIRQLVQPYLPEQKDN